MDDTVERLERMVRANEGAIEIMRGSEHYRKRPGNFTASFAELEADIVALREAIRAVKGERHDL